MKNTLILILSIFLLAGIFTACSKTGVSKSNEVVVYTYDSFSGEWGAGPGIAESFEKASGIKVTYVDCGDGIEILSRAIREKDQPLADVLLGLDNNIAKKAADSGVLADYKAKNLAETLDSDLITGLNPDGKNFLTPYDYSHFAINFDTESGLEAPKSLEDLCKSEYSKKIILLDPRTSTPGLGFAAWTVAVFGDDYENYWKDLKDSILTLSPSWSSGYGLYTKGEAPLVISYTTSPAYHVEYDKTDRYKALIFEQGHVRQIEGAGLVKGCKNEENAKLFLDYLISEEAQNNIPLTQWMFPVNKNVQLPESYSAAPVAGKTLDYDAEKVQDAVEKIIKVINE